MTSVWICNRYLGQILQRQCDGCAGCPEIRSPESKEEVERQIRHYVDAGEAHVSSLQNWLDRKGAARAQPQPTKEQVIAQATQVISSAAGAGSGGGSDGSQGAPFLAGHAPGSGPATAAAATPSVPSSASRAPTASPAPGGPSSAAPTASPPPPPPSPPSQPPATAAKTLPSGPPNPGAVPRGRRTPINPNDDAETKRSLARENDSADVLSRLGYDVEQNPPKGGASNPDSQPDYLIEGRIFDCYAPSATKSPRGIWSYIEEEKLQKGQTSRVALNLQDWKGNIADLKKQFQDWPMAGLDEVIVVMKDESVFHLVP